MIKKTVEEQKQKVNNISMEEQGEEQTIMNCVPGMGDIKMEIELQYREHETDIQKIAKRVTEDYISRGNRGREIKKVHIYLKPTDFTAYYVINDSFEGKVSLF